MVESELELRASLPCGVLWHPIAGFAIFAIVTKLNNAPKMIMPLFEAGAVHCDVCNPFPSSFRTGQTATPAKDLFEVQRVAFIY